MFASVFDRTNGYMTQSSGSFISLFTSALAEPSEEEEEGNTDEKHWSKRVAS